MFVLFECSANLAEDIYALLRCSLGDELAANFATSPIVEPEGNLPSSPYTITVSCYAVTTCYRTFCALLTYR
jgi:hypothetical protein